MTTPGVAKLADHFQGADALAGRQIAKIETMIVDCPTTRRHKLSNTEINFQSYVIVRAELADGSVGWGEASTLGGPRWAEESVEAVKANIDTYLAPALAGANALDFELNAAKMARAASRNNAARAAVDAALYDAAGHSLDLPVAVLLGGAVRDRIEVIWALASGDADQEIEEAIRKFDAREHRRFKIKLGFNTPDQDMIRLRKIVSALEGKATEIIVDVNQGWTEAVAIRYLPKLAEMGVSLIEQPLRPGLIAATARVAARAAIPIMVDEAAFTGPEIVANAIAAAGSVYSLKLVKSGGLNEIKRAAGIAQACGMELYGGCLIESGIGAAAHLAVFSTLPRLEWGCEHFGPKILKTDLTGGEIRFADFHVHCPTGPGLGITVNEELLASVARKG